MAINWARLAKDRRVQIGAVAAAALAGGVALWRRKATTGSTEGDGGRGSLPIGRPLEGAAFPDTTGTSVAQWLGQQQQFQQQMFQEWLAQLREAIPATPAPRLPTGSAGVIDASGGVYYPSGPSRTDILASRLNAPVRHIDLSRYR